MIEYAEYKELTDILARSDVSNTYEDLMKKESQVLDTVNALVKHYKEENNNKRLLYKKSTIDLISGFFIELSEMSREILMIKNPTIQTFRTIATKNDRLIYLGLLFVIVSILLTLVLN
jgi:hypothetical protein